MTYSNFNRRTFLSRSALLAAGTSLLPTISRAGTVLDLAQRRDRGLVDLRELARSAELRALVQKALDTALAHKASYADVHLSLAVERFFKRQSYQGEMCTFNIGVRALNNGYWGYASAPWLSDADVVRVAIDAATHAAGFGLTRPPRPMMLVPNPQIERNGDWTTPAEILPYEVEIGEVLDSCKGRSRYYRQIFKDRYDAVSTIGESSWGEGVDGFHLGRTDVIDATSEGSYTVQTFHHGEPSRSESSIYESFGPRVPYATLNYVAYDTGILPSLSPTTGWENYLRLPIEEMFDRWVEEIKWAKSLPVKPVEVGKYDVLFDWQTMGRMLGATLGPATQLDLAIGDHANGVGTSYLGPDIETYLGSKVAAPQVTIRADRSTPGAAATFKWDCEGVVPREVELVKDGILVNYQTGREGAGLLRSIPGAGMPDATSTGYMGRAGEMDDAVVPLQHLPNFTLVPDAKGTSFAEIVRSMKKGYVLTSAPVASDFQCLNGVAEGRYGGRLYEVENGKITAHVAGGSILFRSPEFWTNILALGGPESLRWTPVGGLKGEPLQRSVTSVGAVPALVKQVTMVRSDLPAAP